MPTRVPLAWRNLTHNRVRFALALAGITFAVFLMFMQYGFRNALFDSTAELLRRLNGELLITHKLKYQLALPMEFSRRRIYQARSVEGVAAVEPVYMERYRSQWVSQEPDPAARSTRALRLLAVDPDGDALAIPEVRANAAALKSGGKVLFDERSRAAFGPRAPGTRAVLSGRDVTIIDTFRLGTDFTTDATAVVGTGHFAETFAHPLRDPAPLSGVSIGVVRLEEGADPAEVLRRLRAVLPEDVTVRTREEFVAQEIEFWQKSTPVGFAFGFGVAMGFVVGVIICYQILSADVADHLAEYATLKAIGYSDRYLTGVVLRQALTLALVGFVPGLAVSWLLYQVLSEWTGLPMVLTWGRVALILGLTVAMCAVSGVVALRRVRTADPAEVFG
ncbi:MAG TPA: ABC transporter permease DevC [Gemmataceae bacterium]